MRDSSLLHDLILQHAVEPDAERVALTHLGAHISYGRLAASVCSFAAGVRRLGLARQERVAIYLDKRPEFVVSAFGAAAAGCEPSYQKTHLILLAP